MQIRAVGQKEALALLLSIERPAVLFHVRPDGDAVGSAAALCEIYRLLGKPAVFACADEIPARLAFLTEGMMRTETLAGYTPVAIDVASEGQLGDLSRKTADNPVALAIDHHAVNTPFSPHYTVPEASSSGEVLYDLVAPCFADGTLPLNERLAALLFAAITSDTGCFAFSNATAHTHRVAADLIGTGIDAADLNQRLFGEKSRAQIKADGLVAAALCSDGAVSYAVVSRAAREEAGLASSDFDCAIDIVRSLAGTRVAFLVKETDEGEYKVSLRSTGADVARVAAVFGGGGHHRAAGCTVCAAGVQEAARAVLAAVKENLSEELS